MQQSQVHVVVAKIVGKQVAWMGCYMQVCNPPNSKTEFCHFIGEKWKASGLRCAISLVVETCAGSAGLNV